MNKKNINKFLQSFVALPLLATTMSFPGIPSIQAPTLLALGNSTVDAQLITTEEAAIRKEKADKIDAYFASKNAPLEGYGMKFVIEAEKNDIDWRLLPAISMRESTGGKQPCKSLKAPNSVFGYGSCKFGFSTLDESIEKVSASLGGNNPNTAHHYEGKTTEQILKKYNPDSIVPGYSKQVMKIMTNIDSSEIQ